MLFMNQLWALRICVVYESVVGTMKMCCLRISCGYLEYVLFMNQLWVLRICVVYESIVGI